MSLPPLTVWYLHFEELGLRKATIHPGATCKELERVIAADAYNRTIELSFWQPKTPLSGLATPSELRKRFNASKPIEQSCTRLDPSMLVCDLLELKYELPVDECIPLVVCSDVSQKEVSPPENDGLLVQAFHRSIQNVQKERPLHMSADQNAHLGTRSISIGRHSECDLPAISTPVELYHPVFCRFRQGGNDRSVLPPPDVVAETVAFMKSTENNWDQMRPIDHLLKILGISNGVIADEVYPSPSSVVLYPSTLHKSAPAAIVLEGLKFGSGGSDSTTEAFYVYKKLWAQPGRRKLLESSSSPTFLVTLTGRWLCILGAVWTTKPIVQRLTDMIWLGTSPVPAEATVLGIARTLLVLRQNIESLENYYRTLELAPLANDRHKRFYPFITSYSDPRNPGRTIEFEYIQPLEKDASDMCVTYRAKTINTCNCTKDIVVKFVREYGEDVHRLLSSRGMAPDLFYLGRISPGSEFSVVVMSYIQGKTVATVFGCMEVSDEVYQGVKEALNVLHEAGFVHGDLRRPNIMTDNGKVILIDYDWAGLAGTARYPSFLNPRTAYPKGVGPRKEITKEHDEWMLEELRRSMEW
ncbi:hypothetical protein VKT23_010342 [Stygiomarasmius scandens]|uniref:non-specific serine/threonine protein kinase n=1 Tax=Marasmiellus scandens TaxID=2682957 RepID=A0ABR1JH62_9AGAR